MAVYFIRSGDDGPVKIGWAKNAEARLRQLQVSHHEPLCMVRLIDGSRDVEDRLHKRFAASRLVGEWFRFDGEMLVVEPPDLGPPRLNWRQRKTVAARVTKPTPVSWAADRCTAQRPCTHCLGLLPVWYQEPFA